MTAEKIDLALILGLRPGAQPRAGSDVEGHWARAAAHLAVLAARLVNQRRRRWVSAFMFRCPRSCSSAFMLLITKTPNRGTLEPSRHRCAMNNYRLIVLRLRRVRSCTNRLKRANS